MKYIDHQAHSVAGSSITQQYISSCLNQTARKYENVSYDGFRQSPCFQQMLVFLCSMQHDFCCYCMRRTTADSGHATIEHIVPQSAVAAPVPGKKLPLIQDFFNYGHWALDPARIILNSQFRAARHQHVPPYPHDVAYYNFAMSCDGMLSPDSTSSSCCNNRRGNKVFNPVFMLSDIEERVVYLPNGFMRPKTGENLADEIQKMIGAVRLDCRELCCIRDIWYRLRKSDLQQLKAANSIIKRMQLLLTEAGLDPTNSVENGLINKYKQPVHWDILMAYDWFHGYYNRNYP